MPLALHHLRGLVRLIDADLEEIAYGHGALTPAGIGRACDALRVASAELTAAIAAVRLAPASAAPPLTAEVISPGADRADELVRSIPQDVVSMSERAVALRLDVRDDAAGTRLLGEVMRRNGWHQGGRNWWRRVAQRAADLASEQPR